ncbi:MAG: AI-2E family transporter [Bryobacterales bacterium]|nr:AI-2E family transporter [Bryobacterales bacterium]
MLGIDSKTARITWTVFLVLLLIDLAWMARTTLFVFTIALLLTYLVHPLVELAKKVLPPKWPASVAPALVYAAGLVIAIGAALVIGTQVAAEASQLAGRLPELLRQRDHMLENYLPAILRPYQDQIASALSGQLETGKEMLLPALSAVGKGLLSQLSSLLYVVLIPILAFLIELGLGDIRGAVVALFTRDDHQQLAHNIVGDVDVLLGLYMRAVFLLALATFTSHMLVFGLAGVPYAVLLAGVCGLLEFVPVVGPLSGMVIVTLVAAFSGYPHVGGLIVFFLLYRLFQDYVLQPYLYSAGIEMHPLLVLFGVLAGEQVGGITGMFLSVPLLAIFRVIYRRSFGAREI